MRVRIAIVAWQVIMAACLFAGEQTIPPAKIDPVPQPLASDPSIHVDYDIVYVRAPRFVTDDNGDRRPSAWPEIAHPTNIDPGYDLMILHPDGTEDVLVAGGAGSIADPYVSFDGQWVYYAHFYLGNLGIGSDIYKVHVDTREVVRLTHQESTPNAGYRNSGTVATIIETSSEQSATMGRGVWNLGPCPLPGGRIAFTSTRDQIKVPRGYPRFANQLYVMDVDGLNIEKIGHLNVGGALHPVILKDGRIIFSSLESQGHHGSIAWGIWSIHPDGTNWEPILSALYGTGGADDAFHFQSQLSDGRIVIEMYYNQNTMGFGSFVALPPRPPEGTPPFGPAYNPAVETEEFGWDVPRLFMRGRGTLLMPFQPYGMEVLTPFTHGSDTPAPLSNFEALDSLRVGKLTHPCGAPDNHLLTVWSPGSMPSANRGDIPYDDPLDAGLYLIKDGAPVMEPAQMRLIKNDPSYNEQWPRPLVPYRRVYGVDEPELLPEVKNDGSASPHLPEGTPFGLVGTSSLYKRESYPHGYVPEGSVTAIGDPYAVFSHSMTEPFNWGGQGADAGLYENSVIHAIRILAMEPATMPVAGRFFNHARERLRILGEIPVRKFDGGEQPIDPDGNPDTSFLAKIPADVAFTFQTLDKEGMVLNMAQTWHQLRPGEIRHNCGGCHAHSQKPTLFEDTAAARDNYEIFDLTRHTPLLTEKANDVTKRQWDKDDSTGLSYGTGVLDVEYHRDVKPILERSCVACHSKRLEKPAGGLVLDDDTLVEGPRWDLGNAGPLPATYNTLAGNYIGVTKYVKGFQSRRSLLMWKIYGRRLDGFPEQALPGREDSHRRALELDGVMTGGIMPPRSAIESGKVEAISADDRRTLIRWIDLGCPIDTAYDPQHPDVRGDGWMLDDQRPTLTLTYPRRGENELLSRIVIGMHDYNTGLDRKSLRVVADFELAGQPAGADLSSRFESMSNGIWTWTFAEPIAKLDRGILRVSVKDRQGNETRIERMFSVAGGQ